MTHAQGKPAVEKARAFIESSLRSREWKKGDCLPSVRDLARLAEVSPGSVLKAIAMLRGEGLIHGSERARQRVGPQNEQPVIKPSAGWESPVWQVKRTALERDVLEGVWAREAKLPSIKELCIRYGACFVTMRKALRSMVDDGVVQLYRGAYRLPQVASRRFRRRIVFISYRLRAIQWSALNQGQYRVLDLLEGECARQQVNLEVVEADFNNLADARRAISVAAAGVPAAGYFLDALWTIDKKQSQALIDLLTLLAATHLPVAILDESGEFELPISFASNPLMQVFRIEGEKAGGRVARMLLRLGHRSVAFISWQHGQRYSVQRLAGVNKQFVLAGCPDNVHTVLNGSMDEFFRFLAMSDFGEALIRRIIAIDRTDRQTEETFRQFLAYRRTAVPLRLDRGYVFALQKKISCIADLFKRNTDKQYFDRMVGAAVIEATEEFSALFCRSMCERALRHADVTAWICATDGIAGIALKFLRGAGVSVPREISVVGFDNMPVAALEQRLTSLDFNAPGFVHRILNYIARPPRPRGPYRHAPIEVESVVMERDTTAPPFDASTRLRAALR